MEFAQILTDLIVVLVAAKFAAELSERVGIPAVVGEIVAGVIVGGSALGLLGEHNEVLHVLGELGVILLLLEVGMEMDLAELGKVGRSSFLVAVIGVVAPMALGFGVMQTMLDADFNTSLFVGAALTATSVGITARVFGDLRALATTEARVVLGAAVADDVMGLVVLTVVVRLVTEGSVSALTVLGIIGVAVAFLAVGAGAGLRLAAPLFSAIDRVSRSTGTLVALAFVFAIGFARLAAAAKLAPIVGAFVAGLALTRSRQADHIRRELAPVGHLLIPVFFLQIGTQADVAQFASAAVLRDAALLFVVAAIGKLLSPLGAFGIKGDKVLIGLGMLPRGEVGLIFATLGKQAGVLDDELYAALLLVVLVTTLITPQLLKLRYSRLATPTTTIDEIGEPEPAGGFLRITDRTVELAARPPAVNAGGLALDAAVDIAYREPGPELTSWLTAAPDVTTRWRPELYERLLDLAERGNARSWRFLDVTGVLESMVPSLDAAFARRRDDARAMDPLARYRLAGLERLRRLDGDDPVAVVAQQLLHPDRLILALLLMDATDGSANTIDQARAFVDDIGLEPEAADEVVALVREEELLWAASMRAAAFAPEYVVELAAHLESPERARAIFVATMLHNGDAERWQLGRVKELYALVTDVLARDASLTGGASEVIAQHRAEAIALAGDDEATRRISAAPRSYLLRQPAAAIARQAEILRRPLHGHDVRIRLSDRGDRHDQDWSIDIAAHDRPGLLADVTGVLADHGLSVLEAVVATWPDGVALETFRVRGPQPDLAGLEADIERAFARALTTAPLAGAEITFDASASPWHTVCEIAAPDQPRLLHTIAAAVTAAGVDVVAATITEEGGTARDRFELVDKNGRKLSAAQEAQIEIFLHGGVKTTRRWFRQHYEPAT